MVDRMRIGSKGWEICGRRDCTGCNSVPAFDAWVRDPEWLRRFKNDFGSMSALRALCGQLGLYQTYLLEDEEILEQIAHILHERHWHICREATIIATGGGVQAEAAGRKPEGPGPATGKPHSRKTWVEFAVVDMEGNPAFGHRFMVMLPDGSLHEGTLGKTGRVRFENIDPDTSVFSLPDLDREVWERVD
ncbi:MAG: hypothetical protein ACLQGV_10345 [Bryobacteraceae bacterium]